MKLIKLFSKLKLWYSQELRVSELEAAIRKHRDQTGNNLCWENDRELWSVLADTPSNMKYPHKSLPIQEEFLGNCQRYYESRLCEKGK